MRYSTKKMTLTVGGIDKKRRVNPAGVWKKFDSPLRRLEIMLVARQ
jgi:hypothetical protein